MRAMHIRDGAGERLVFPGAIELSILISGGSTGGAFALYEDIVAPGMGPPRHIHKAQDELFHVLDGRFDIEIDGEVFHASVGDVAFVPRGSIHAFRNIGERPGRLRYSFTPAGDSEAMFRAFYDAARQDALTPSRMAEIAAMHDQIITGAPL